LEPHGLLVDCTLGAGGHAELLMDRYPGFRLLGLDRDPQAIQVAKQRLERFGERAQVRKANFAEMKEVLGSFYEDEQVSAVLYDFGVSSGQLDRAERGFGYRDDAGLDMRMDPEVGPRAADVVNTYPYAALAEVISRYGEERFASRIARAIERRRRTRPFESTIDLAEVVKQAIPAATRRTGPHPARRTFQALRIEVNGELDAITESLPQAIEALRPGGRLAAISYHSLEDRIVKNLLRDLARGCVCKSDIPICICGREATVRMLTGKPSRPSDQEVAANPRSRSAKLRVAEKLGMAA